MAKAITLWLKALSYFAPQLIDSGKSNYSGFLELSLSKNRFMLLSNNAIYSFEDLYYNFNRTFKQINIAQSKYNEILVLGMGLGSVPQMLIEKYGQANANYTLVEVDPLVIEWTESYTLPKMKAAKSINIVQQDAFQFVQNAIKTYDLIVIDVFIDDIIPDNIQSEVFLEKIKAMMNSKALVLFNCLYQNPKDKVNTKAFYENHFSKVFDNHSALDVSTNLMLCARL